MSRKQEKLNRVRASIVQDHPIDVVCVANDAGECHVDPILAAVKGKHLCILVNNVGVWTGDTMNLHKLPESQLRDIVNVNNLFPTLLTHGALPYMLESVGNAGTRGLIINVASMAAHLRVPLLSAYCASKAFTRNFSMSLSAEYVDKGIDVLAVNPGYVDTKMLGEGKPRIITCSPTECVDSCLRRTDEVDILPHYKHLYLVSFQVLEFLVPAMFRSGLYSWMIATYYKVESVFKKLNCSW